MGLLDDAIREHLDLKRRRGADPTDIERAEREALGPVRRNRDPAGDDAAADPAVVQSAYDEPDEGVATDLVEAVPPQPDPDAAGPAGGDPSDEQDWSYDDERTRIIAPEEAGGAAPDIAPPDEPPARDVRGALAFDDTDEPFADSEPLPGTPPAGGETREFDVEEALAAEEEAARAAGREDEDEDVLEDTPEFLQDTPDHDRLWFEQRPPRDFDFDG